MALQLLFACYFFGIYWYVYSETIKIYMEEVEIDNTDLYMSWVENDSWNIKDE